MTYDRKTILDALKQNRIEHEKTYHDAYEGFKLEVVEQLEASLKKAKAGEAYPVNIDATKPVHYLKDYDRTIRMFEMTNQNQIQLTTEEFNQYVMNDWRWNSSFESSTIGYAAKFRAAK